MIDLDDFSRVRKRIASYRGEMIDLQRGLTAIPAISPDNGGEGEYEKARYLMSVIEAYRLGTIVEINAPDPRARGGVRPNIVIRHRGNHSRTVWIITHMDIVPPGEISMWEGDPYVLRTDGQRIYGRGVEDNQQDLVASLFAARACIDEGVSLSSSIGLIFVSDEETASSYGLDYLIKHPDNPIRKEDLIVVPDSGTTEGTMIEIAEKSILWLRFRTVGKQCHGSTPSLGRNAFLAASRLIVSLHEGLHKRFHKMDPLYDPPVSTFEPTKREANVPNVNTIPGEDVFFMDCRILPDYNLEEVESYARSEADRIETQFGVRVEISAMQRVQAPPPTRSDASVVAALKEAIGYVYGVEATPRGIGAGTVAAYLRLKGYPAAVWSRGDHTAHQPNEYCIIDNMVGNAEVFAYLFLRRDIGS